MKLRSRNKRQPPRAAAAAIGLGLGVAGGAIAAVRRRARGGDDGGGTDSSGSPGRTAASDGDGDTGAREWQCACGQEFRVTGEGRHRVFWLPDAAPEEAILDDQCPNCERKLSFQD